MAKKFKKKDFVDRHFANRCLQRLGHLPDSKDLVNKIQNQELQFVDRQSNRLTRWLWLDKITNIECVLVYDKIRKQLVTILFKDLMDLSYNYLKFPNQNRILDKTTTLCYNIDVANERR